METRVLKEIIITEEEIKNNCKRLAVEIKEDYKDKKPAIFLGLLKGCHPFMTDLLSHIDLDLQVDYMDVSSYFGGSKSTNDVKILKDMTIDVKGRDVVIVEDIIDSGRTLKKIIEILKEREAKSIEVVTMLDKPSGRTVELEAKYVGSIVPDAFLIGYGLDYNEMYRNLRSVGIPKDELVKETNE